jgi:trans-2,3-dihydro-3-hydroxyanthranilate isomerase
MGLTKGEDLMRSYPFKTVDVFTDTRFGGNQLAVFTDARGLSDAEMQALAAEMNLSETTFVLPPEHPSNSAQVRIFNRTAEMPFAGHPNVGTAFVLASRTGDASDVLRFEEMAGLVEVRIKREGDRVVGAEIDAPQPLQLLGELPTNEIAACIGLAPDDVRTQAHAPLRATVGVEFVLVEVTEDALVRAAPDMVAFRRTAAAHPQTGERLSVFLYAHVRSGVRARMFAPLSGTWEDPATGSANATLGALLLSLSNQAELSYQAVQGLEMGRPSHLRVTARRRGDEIYASVGGHCVPVLSGEALV